MQLNEADAGHAREVAVERPDRGVLVGRYGSDQKVCEAETFSGRPRRHQPVVDAQPGLLSREEKRQRRKYTTQRNIRAARSSRQNLDTHPRTQSDLTAGKQPRKR